MPDITTTADTVVAPPHQAVLVPSGRPHRQYAIAVTNEHGLEVKEIDDSERYPYYPDRVQGTRTVTELESFLAELQRRELPGSTGTLWGNAQRGRIEAIYNDHNGDDIAIANWRDDKLELALVQDEDWKAWHAISGKYYSQEEFGDIIEELLHTVIEPDQADLLEVIDSVRASSRGQFESSIERSIGSQKLVYSEEVAATAGRASRTLEVPKIVKIRLRPWEGHIETYDIEAWFRLRTNGGQLGLAIKLKPTRQIIRQAWDDLIVKVVAQTGKPVLAQP